MNLTLASMTPYGSTATPAGFYQFQNRVTIKKRELITKKLIVMKSGGFYFRQVNNISKKGIYVVANNSPIGLIETYFKDTKEISFDRLCDLISKLTRQKKREYKLNKLIK